MVNNEALPHELHLSGTRSCLQRQRHVASGGLVAQRQRHREGSFRESGGGAVRCGRRYSGALGCSNTSRSLFQGLGCEAAEASYEGATGAVGVEHNSYAPRPHRQVLMGVEASGREFAIASRGALEASVALARRAAGTSARGVAGEDDVVARREELVPLGDVWEESGRRDRLHEEEEPAVGALWPAHVPDIGEGEGERAPVAAPRRDEALDERSRFVRQPHGELLALRVPHRHGPPRRTVRVGAGRPADLPAVLVARRPGPVRPEGENPRAAVVAEDEF